MARTHADVAGIVENVAWRTLALVSPRRIDANTIEAHVRT